MLRELPTPDDTGSTASKAQGHLLLRFGATGKDRGTGQPAAPAGFPTPDRFLLQEAEAPDVRNGSRGDWAGKGLGSGRDRGNGGAGSSPR